MQKEFETAKKIAEESRLDVRIVLHTDKSGGEFPDQAVSFDDWVFIQKEERRTLNEHIFGALTEPRTFYVITKKVLNHNYPNEPDDYEETEINAVYTIELAVKIALLEVISNEIENTITNIREGRED